ncbi:MAG TPA: hypothetical protein VJ011_11910 [Steroidobacteraceae bacterium]|nr:hypothetical protein [Steroidobacteraceae bacterium]
MIQISKKRRGHAVPRFIIERAIPRIGSADAVAADERLVHEHAERSGFPATKVTPVRSMIDPTTAEH